MGILNFEMLPRHLPKIDKILICRPEGCDWEMLKDRLKHLKIAADQYQREDIIRLLEEIIPGYQPHVPALMESSNYPEPFIQR